MQNMKTKIGSLILNMDELTQKSLALLEILAISSKSLKEGKFTPIDEAFVEIEEKIKESNAQGVKKRWK